MSDHFPPELHGAIPPPPPAALPHPPITIAAVAAEVHRLGQDVKRIIGLLTKDGLDRNAPDGLVQLQEAQGRQLEDHEVRLIAIEDERTKERQAATEAATKAADTWATRAWAAFYDLAKMAGAAGLGAWFTKGGNP